MACTNKSTAASSLLILLPAPTDDRELLICDDWC